MGKGATVWRWVRRLLAGLLVLAAAGGAAAYHLLLREEPQQFAAPDEEFKYGSIGTEENEGLPYWVWLVLPRVFPDLLPGPGGYTSLGLVWEEGKETPVGFSKRTIGFPRIGINCALCHTSTYRLDPRQSPTIVPGGAATRLNVLGYQRFLFACATDPRFTPDRILAEIEYNTKLSPADKLLYRHVLIPRTKDGILETKKRFAWTESRPDWGCGRIDPFNPVKFHQLKMDPAADQSIGNSDMEPLWNRAARKGHALHWDGLNDDLTEVVMSGAVGDGGTAKTLPYDRLTRIEQWLQHLPAPKYPAAVDATLVAQGEPIYRQTCGRCHTVGGELTGKVIPLDKINTDAHRIGMWSQAAADIYNRMPLQPPYGFSHFRKQNGYVAVPLDGVWLRGPYLHNGSVPTLDDLLKPTAERPKSFYRGYDVLDPVKVGFVCQPPLSQKKDDPAVKAFGTVYTLYDTKVPGNGNGGHDGPEYGTGLPADQKKALIEYLKTQ